jgi:integrase
MMGRSAGLSDLKPHDLRHTRAYRLLDQFRAQGVPDPVALEGVRKEMRHSDSRTTQKFYLRPRDSQVRAAVEAM